MRLRWGLVLGSILVVALTSGCLRSGDGRLTQVSTLSHLQAGKYDGIVPYSRLKRMGNYGLGTFDRLDGEMVALDGDFYQVKGDGVVARVNMTQSAPFASVFDFRPRERFRVDRTMSYEAFREWMDTKRTDPLAIYAIRIEGEFEEIRFRSVPPQEKPYPSIQKVLKAQSVFRVKGQKATLIGLYAPAYMSEVLFGGYHFHGLTESREQGGHVLDFWVRSGDVSIQVLHKVDLQLP